MSNLPPVEPRGRDARGQSRLVERWPIRAMKRRTESFGKDPLTANPLVVGEVWTRALPLHFRSQLATTRKSFRAAPPRSELVDTYQPRFAGTGPDSTVQM
jgi:hypothetical protein